MHLAFTINFINFIFRRSEKLNSFLNKLDARFESKNPKQPCTKHVIGSTVDVHAPTHAKSWMLNQNNAPPDDAEQECVNSDQEENNNLESHDENSDNSLDSECESSEESEVY